jgi:hypothetical protein
VDKIVSSRRKIPKKPQEVLSCQRKLFFYQASSIASP